METPLIKFPMKGEILRKVTQRFPDIDADAVEALTTLQSVAKALSVIMNEPLAEIGLSEGRCFLLFYLWSEDIMGNGHPSPSDIAEHLGVTRATITGLLDGLERDGFVERHQDSQDRRALTICMTGKAVEFMNVYAPAQGVVIRKLFAPLSANEKRVLIDLLNKINLQSQAALPAPETRSDDNPNEFPEL